MNSPTRASRPVGAMEALALGPIEWLLDRQPNALFFIKDTALRYVRANAAMRDLCSVLNHSDFAGRTARDFLPEPVWRGHEAADRLVMRTRRPMRDQLYFWMRTPGSGAWLLLSRWPLLGADGEAVGIAGIARVLQAPNRDQPAYEGLSPAIREIHTNLHAPLDVANLAALAGVSIPQLQRGFVDLLGLPPQRYFTKIRVQAALKRLRAGGSTGDVARACGYLDQSALTRRFKAIVGMAPSEYQRTYCLVAEEMGPEHRPTPVPVNGARG